MKPIERILDFVERWNKNDEDKEVAQAAIDLKSNITRIEKERDQLLKRLVQIKRFIDEVEENHNAGTSSTCELCHVFNLTKQAIQSVEGGKK